MKLNTQKKQPIIGVMICPNLQPQLAKKVNETCKLTNQLPKKAWQKHKVMHKLTYKKP